MHYHLPYSIGLHDRLWIFGIIGEIQTVHFLHTPCMQVLCMQVLQIEGEQLKCDVSEHLRLNFTWKNPLPAFADTKYGLNSICYHGAETWNILPYDVKGSSSLNELARRIMFLLKL